MNISFIITTYNSMHYIDRIINNINNQFLNLHSYDGIEIILVDDGSTDNTLEVIQKTFSLHPCVKIISNTQNFGPGNARNRGLDNATGCYVLFLDADDIYHPQLFSLCSRLAPEINLDILIFKANRLHSVANVTTDIHYPIFDKFDPGQVFSAKDIENSVFDSATWWSWDRLIRRQFILENDIKFPDIPSSEDLFFNSSLFLLASSISYIDVKLITYVENESNSVSSTREFSAECCISAVQMLKDFLISRGLFLARRADFSNYLISFLNWHLESINGVAYFQLFDAVKFFLIENIENSDDLLYQEKQTYEYLVSVSAHEYLIFLKNKFYAEKDLLARVNASLTKQIDKRA